MQIQIRVRLSSSVVIYCDSGPDFFLPFFIPLYVESGYKSGSRTGTVMHSGCAKAKPSLFDYFGQFP
jgi:hypothetical protein